VERRRVERDCALYSARVLYSAGIAIAQAPSAILEQDSGGNGVGPAVFDHHFSVPGQPRGERNRDAPHAAIKEEFLMLIAGCNRSGVCSAGCIVAAWTPLIGKIGRRARLDLDVAPA